MKPGSDTVSGTSFGTTTSVELDVPHRWISEALKAIGLPEIS